jgi:hypothetical protein
VALSQQMNSTPNEMKTHAAAKEELTIPNIWANRLAEARRQEQRESIATGATQVALRRERRGSTTRQMGKPGPNK